tara:strand:- start:3500 stop:4393 length:894 start_codon:yes stop_codon:yes gene_type:complete
VNILITGDRGFFGRHLKRRYTNHEIFVSNTSVRNLNNIENLYDLNTKKLDLIFHLAAKTKAGDWCLSHSGDQWIDNQIINTTILKYWKEYQPQATMVCMGTSCAYDPKLPLTEDHYLLGSPSDDLLSYAMTKRMLLHGLIAINKQYGLNYRYYIPSTLYGPDFDLDDSHFIFDLIKKIYRGKKYGEKVELWGDGLQCRELIHVDDAIDIMNDTSTMNNQIFNVCSGLEYPIAVYASIICDILKFNPNKIEYNPNKYVGVRSKRLNPNKIGNYPCFPKQRDIISGITSTINSFLDKVE